MSWFKKLKDGLTKTSNNISKGITEVFTHKTLDENTLEDLEDLLIMSDLGSEVAADVVSNLAKDKFNKEISDEEIKEYLAGQVAGILEPVAKPLITQENPHLILVCGVNGNGKTTTIGKLALKYKQEGKKVMMVACDTFRAAAVDQLEVWAERAGCPIITGEPNSDAASVAFRAFEQAKAEGYDVVLIDTAGRLHNKQNLMDELAKIIRVIKKVDDTAPHNTLLVLDATTGQNAISQVETFKKMIDISGLIVTKLDGTAKGGIIVAIAKKFGLPIHAVGVGETIEDLNEFDPSEFSKVLVG